MNLDPSLLPAYHALIAERGGPSKFSDWQLTLAASIVQMTADMARAESPLERAKIATAMAPMMPLLPPVPPVIDRESRTVTREQFEKMSLHEMSALYAACVADPSIYVDCGLDDAADDARMQRAIDMVLARRVDSTIPTEAPPGQAQSPDDRESARSGITPEPAYRTHAILPPPSPAPEPAVSAPIIEPDPEPPPRRSVDPRLRVFSHLNEDFQRMIRGQK